MSKPTQGGKNGGNSKVEETGTAKNAGNSSSGKGNSQSAGAGSKASSAGSSAKPAGKASTGSKSK